MVGTSPGNFAVIVTAGLQPVLALLDAKVKMKFCHESHAV